jgi:hypothetical protein
MWGSKAPLPQTPRPLFLRYYHICSALPIPLRRKVPAGVLQNLNLEFALEAGKDSTLVIRRNGTDFEPVYE